MLFDVAAVPEMKGLEERDSELWIGALTTYAELAASPFVARHAPALRTACAIAGSAQIRNRATLGGCLASAAPWVDALPALLVADAVLELVSISARRDVPVASFLTGPAQTVLAPDELIVSVRVPRREGVRGAFQRLAQRQGPVRCEGFVRIHDLQGRAPRWVACPGASEPVGAAPACR